MKQADEQVVDGHIQANSGDDVVALSAVDDPAGFKQDHDGSEDGETSRHRQVQDGALHEERQQHRADQHEGARCQEAGQEAEVLLGDNGRCRQTHKRGRCQSQGIRDDLGSARCHHLADDRAEGEAHEAGKGERGYDTPGAVLQLVGREQKADVAYDRDQEAGMRAVHVQERSQCGECQSHSQQHVGIAQHVHGICADTRRPTFFCGRIGSLVLLDAKSSVFHCLLRLCVTTV